jgi:MerR family transcriptional regulator, heat shock protein HspR
MAGEGRASEKEGKASMTTVNRAGDTGWTDRQHDRAVYVISVAAELAGVHPQTLRIYERKGLLNPARTPGNTRRYSDRDIARLQMIQRLTQQSGVNLAGVKMIVEMENELDRMRERMRELDRELQRARERFQAEVERVHRQYRAEMVPLASLRVSSVRPERPSTERSGRRRIIPVGPSTASGQGI